MTASLARSDLQRLRDLADSWKRHRRSAWFADGLHLTLDAIEARREEGGDVLNAHVYGDSVPEMHAAALLKAAELWGPKADLAVEETGTVGTSSGSRPRFHAGVYVRCINYAEISS